MVSGVKSKKRSAIWQEKKEAHQFFFGGFGGGFFVSGWGFFVLFLFYFILLITEKGSLNLAFLLIFLFIKVKNKYSQCLNGTQIMLQYC